MGNITYNTFIVTVDGNGSMDVSAGDCGCNGTGLN
jgi:hypothetical protein